MENVRFEHGMGEGGMDAGVAAGGGGRGAGGEEGGGGGRLNLLLSWGGWQEEGWVQRLPRLLEPMGVRSVWARSAREAERVVRQVPVHIAVVDLAIPMDEAGQGAGGGGSGGGRVLELLQRARTRPVTVVVKGTVVSRDETRHLAAALRSDAFAVVDRSGADVELMLKVLQRCLAKHFEGRWPGEGGAQRMN